MSSLLGMFDLFEQNLIYVDADFGRASVKKRDGFLRKEDLAS